MKTRMWIVIGLALAGASISLPAQRSDRIGRSTGVDVQERRGPSTRVAARHRGDDRRTDRRRDRGGRGRAVDRGHRYDRGHRAPRDRAPRHRLPRRVRVWVPGYNERVWVPAEFGFRWTPWGARVRYQIRCGYWKTVCVPGRWEYRDPAPRRRYRSYR